MNTGADAPANGEDKDVHDLIKREFRKETLKEALLDRASDRLQIFMMADGTVRGAIVNGTRMIQEMRSNHELGILETVVLGRAYLAAVLMANNLKGNDRLSLQIDCSGPVKGLVVESNAFGEVRGFLKRVPIEILEPLEDLDLSSFFGAGFLTVVRHLEGARQPFSGQVVLQYGNIAMDVANYFLTSEQIATAFNLSIQFDSEGEIVGAGGLFLQAMPDARDETTAALEPLAENFPSLGQYLSGHRDPQPLLDSVFADFAPRVIDQKRIEFMCHCNAARLRSVLLLLPLDELKDILEKGPFPVEMRCHHCNTVYRFEKDDIASIYGQRYAQN